jgi:hypothetical protein
MDGTFFTTRGIGLWSHDKVRAHKGGMRISKKPKKMTVFDVLSAKELMQKL